MRTLNSRVKKTDDILQKDDRVALERHKTSHARHHTSLCDRVQAREPGMTANNIGNTAVIRPVVVVKIGTEATNSETY